MTNEIKDANDKSLSLEVIDMDTTLDTISEKIEHTVQNNKLTLNSIPFHGEIYLYF